MAGRSISTSALLRETASRVGITGRSSPVIAENIVVSGGDVQSNSAPAFSNMTYVTSTPGAVPEIDPSTAHSAVMILVGALGLLERRLRRVALARHASQSE